VLIGYAILEIDAGTAKLLDFLVDDHNGAACPFFAAILRELRSSGISILALRAIDASPVVRQLRSFGFLFRDNRDSTVMVYAKDSGSYGSVLDGKNWFMTQADRDV
jgi:hypothetical protein